MSLLFATIESVDQVTIGTFFGRYFAVLKPLKVHDNRARLMIIAAWVASGLCSLPQVRILQARIPLTSPL